MKKRKPENPSPQDTPMQKAYRIADELLKDKLKKEAPELLEAIKRISKDDVIVTRGHYDYIQDVLAQAGTPFTLLDPHEIDRTPLRSEQMVFVNCPGEFTDVGIRKLAGFVAEGGFLFTTDWALKNVLERAFPGIIEYNQRATEDEVVRVEVLAADDPFLKSILGPGDDPQWWLEGSSYPIRILQPDKVNVLVSSKEIGEKYGESPVFVTFDFGAGKIYHMISHFYLQRTETRTQRQKNASSEYIKEKGISGKDMEKYVRMGVDEVSSGSVESALASKAMFYKMVSDKQAQIRKSRAKK